MKTSLKRFFAGVAAAAMAVGGLALGATSAQAEGTDASTQKGSLTVKAANGTTGHTLKAYLVAAYNSGYQAYPQTDKDKPGQLNFDTFKYVVNKDDASAVVAALKDAKVVDASASDSVSVAEEGLKQLKSETSGTPFGYENGTATASAAERKFADALAAKLDATDSTKWTPSKKPQNLPLRDGSDEFTADLNPEGLYLVVDTYEPQEGLNSTRSVPMLVGTKFANLTKQPANVGEVNMKNIKMPVHKEVVTDKTGATANNKPSYNIGDTVYFHLSTTIPDYSGYAADPTLSPTSGKTRLLRLEDEFEEGKFTDTNVVSVKDSTTDIGKLMEGTDYDVYRKDNKLTVDLKKLVNGYAGAKHGWKKDDVIDVVVSGVLSANAKTTDTVNTNVTTGDDSNGNYNKVTLYYSNNPKDNSQANKVPGDTVNVYSFNLNVNKVDQDNKPLGGAKFKIYTKDSQTPLRFTKSGSTYKHTYAKVGTDGATETLVSDETSGETSGEINVEGLKAGTYVVTETHAPTGFFQGALPSYTVEIAEDYTHDKSNETSQPKSGDDWLTTLTYSYPKLDGNNLVTKNTSSTDKPDTSTATVKNVHSITQLPKTGAAGIAFFSIIGVAIVAMAALFAVRARKASRLA
ncbi:LPXTG cell wall anchor domain-containing protein [Bifidobacterium boum]|uniref:LPXTG cell wall anchor domain-containing protein n=1 Tax=Bifidobacterium boum TaxID=78343 RepID=A0A848D7J3_9BIFI|nr:SpaA isopeptide-forming pilin-related protein [Bifidobacterium boum]NMF02318.1 LPXTG cell wall anchor domain-containing protein [Bifidobacterium boum]